MAEEQNDSIVKKEINELKDLLNYASGIINQYAEKNFDVKIQTTKYKNNQEFLHSISKMKGNVTELITEILQNSYNLNDSSKELITISEQMLHKSSDMNKRAQQVTLSTGEMSNNMITISAAAEELSVNMKTVSSRAEDSSQNIVNVSAAVEEMSATINEIAKHSEQATTIVNTAVNSVKNATDRINELGIATRGINHVTSTISGISDQTKILALNATIEAGRAGEAGIRFGVVAHEVRELAGQTNSATEEIHSKVSVMQQATNTVLNEINQINQVMAEVNSIVATIATAVEEQSATTKEIASNISYASNGIADMSSAVGEAAIAVQEVTTNITQAASLANDVSTEIGVVHDESIAMKEESTTLYANAMEVSSRSTDVKLLVEMIKLPRDLSKVTSGKSDLFEFTEQYSVKVNDLDHEHNGIFNYINDIHKAIKSRASTSTIFKIIKDLNIWTTDHFAHEEELMKSINYPDFANQKRAHTKLLNDIAATIKKFENGEEVNLIELMVFLKDWLVGHILGMDKKYSNPMNNNNIH